MATKSVGLPVLAALGVGVGGAALGLAAAAASVCAGGLVVASPVLGGIYLYKNPPRFMHKYLPPPDNTDFAVTDRERISRGVVVRTPWQHDDPHYIEALQNTGGSKFLGFPGRQQGSVFVAYVDNTHVAPHVTDPLNASFVMYFIPIEAPREDFPEHLQLSEALEVAYPFNRVPYNIASEDPTEDIRSEIFNNIRRQMRLFNRG